MKVDFTLTENYANFHGNAPVDMVASEHGQYQQDGMWFHPHRDNKHIDFQYQIEMYIYLQRK